MKKVIKISLGNIAFTIEEDSFLLLKGYLDELKDYYGNDSNAKEIVDGIEERMAELLLEKLPAGEVVTVKEINEIISVLGRPESFEGEDYKEQTRSMGVKNLPRKLYRDPINKVLGGVLSGFAAYFKLDIILVRIIFIVLAFGLSVFGLHNGAGFGFWFVAYILMWIIIPEAKSLEQKYAMSGEILDYKTIGQKESFVAKKESGLSNIINRFFSVIARVIIIIISFVLIAIALGGLIASSMLFFGIEIFSGFVPIDILGYLDLSIFGSAIYKILLILVVMLPFIGMLYGGICMLFKIKSPKFKPGLIIFLLWILSLISISVLTVKSSRSYWSEASSDLVINVPKSLDTLFINLESETEISKKRFIYDAGKKHYSLFWLTDNNLVLMPNIKIWDVEGLDSARVIVNTYARSSNYFQAMETIEQYGSNVRLKDSILIIKAQEYSKSNKWDGVFRSIIIEKPKDLEVMVNSPIRHSFNKRVKSNFNLD